jgi:hypothetical protein
MTQRQRDHFVFVCAGRGVLKIVVHPCLRGRDIVYFGHARNLLTPAEALRSPASVRGVCVSREAMDERFSQRLNLSVDMARLDIDGATGETGEKADEDEEAGETEARKGEDRTGEAGRFGDG